MEPLRFQVPQGFHRGSTGVPQGVLQRFLRWSYRGSSGGPQGFLRGSTGVPQVVHRGSSGGPQGVLQRFHRWSTGSTSTSPFQSVCVPDHQYLTQHKHCFQCKQVNKPPEQPRSPGTAQGPWNSPGPPAAPEGDVKGLGEAAAHTYIYIYIIYIYREAKGTTGNQEQCPAGLVRWGSLPHLD